jgi:hypothetical protein
MVDALATIETGRERDGFAGMLAHVGDGMRILGFNRVELLMSTDDLNDAVGRFNDLLGTSFFAAACDRERRRPHHHRLGRQGGALRTGASREPVDGQDHQLHPEGPAELIRAAGG